MSAYLPALRRFWWLVAIGFAVAVVAGLASVYKLPSFEQRDQPVYTATARMLVTGSDAPYFRTAVTRTDPTTSSSSITRASGSSSAPLTSPPDVTTLIRAANTFPLIIESDQVGAMREKLFGEAPEGSFVSANAIYQVATPGRFRLSDVPVVQVFGTAPTPEQSIVYTKQTVDAFIRYLKQRQDEAGIPPKQRILIQAIRTPDQAFPSRTTSKSLGILVTFAVALAFCLLAIVVDRLRPVDGGVGGVVATIGTTTKADPQEEDVEVAVAAAAGGSASARRRKAPGSVPAEGTVDDWTQNPAWSVPSPRRAQGNPKQG